MPGRWDRAALFTPAYVQLARAVRNRTLPALYYVLDAKPCIAAPPPNITGLTGGGPDPHITISVFLVDHDYPGLSEADWLIEMAPSRRRSGSTRGGVRPLKQTLLSALAFP